MLLLLFACAGPPISGPTPPDADPTDTATPWAPPRRVALPFAVVGGPPPSVTLEVPDLTATLTGPGLQLQTEPGQLTVSWSGPMDTPALLGGALELTVDGATSIIPVSGVIGAADLGAADWQEDLWGRHALVTLPSAPNAHGATAWTDTRVLIAVPPSFGEGGVHVVTHLHGFYATIADTARDQALREQLAASGRDAVLIAPQGPEEAASGDFGQLMDAGGHARLVQDVVSVLYRDGLTPSSEVGQHVVTAHSGGYQAAAALVRQGGVDAVHLFDALYAESATFEGFVQGGGLLRSSYTAAGGTVDQNAALAARLTGERTTFDDDALAAARLTIGPSWSSHDRCVRDERAYARWLTWSGLPFGSDTAPELRSVVLEGDRLRVRWLGEATMRVESGDGRELGEVTGTEAVVPWADTVRLRQVRDGVVSGPSDTYAAHAGDGGRWLVVDGFDRVLGGSFHAPRHDHAARVARALGRPVDTASNEGALELELGRYEGVMWLLGDESTADLTFDPAERAAIEAFLDDGGRMIVSGSEVGYATDAGWLARALGATWVNDDAGATALDDGRTFGHAYEEDFPDVLAGDEVVWRYAGGQVAAVSDGRVVLVGFGVETFEDELLGGAIVELMGAL